MQIHELNNFTGTLGSGAYLAVDDGNDTGKLSTQQLLSATEARIDNIIAGPAPSAEEIVDARLGADGVTYPSLGDAIRDQVSDLKADLTDKAQKIISLQKNEVETLTLGNWMITNAHHYMNGNGSVSSGNDHNIIQISDNTIKQIILPIMASTVAIPTVIVKNDSTVVAYLYHTTTKEVGIDLTTIEYTDIYINWWNSTNTAWFNSIDIKYDSTIYDSLNALINGVSNKPFSVNFSDFELYQNNKYANGGGSTVTYTNGSGHGVFRMPADDITYVKVEIDNALGTTLTLAVIVDGSDNVIKQIAGQTAGNYEMEISPQRGTYLLVNGFSFKDVPNPYYGDIVIKKSIAEAYGLSDTATNNYRTLARKPFNFSGKTGVFTGDSITYGFTSGQSAVHGTGDYPTLFCAKVGMTNNNISQGGACFCSGYNAVKTIPEQVADVVGSTFDFLFIAGGVNDWQVAAPLSTFITTISNLCSYINTNFPNDLPVIWITPINQAGYETTHPIHPIAQIDEYRRALTRTILENDTYARFSVIQGTDFNFPAYGDDATYISAMFGDLLHPTELGYKTLYVSGLLNALC